MNLACTCTCQRLLGQFALLDAVNHAKPRGRIANDDVVGNAQIRNERKFLEDADNPRLVGSSRCCKGNGFSINFHASFIRRNHARHDLDQRRFACAIFTKDAVNLSGINIKLGTFQSMHTAVTLGDLLHLEKWLIDQDASSPA